MACTLKRDALVHHATDTPAPAGWRPHTAPGRQALFVFGLWAAVLTAGPLAGRRYIDPGSGSFAIQIIIAAVLGGLLTARLWLRHMFWRIFGRRRRSESDDQPSAEEADR